MVISIGPWLKWLDYAFVKQPAVVPKTLKVRTQASVVAQVLSLKIRLVSNGRIACLRLSTFLIRVPMVMSRSNRVRPVCRFRCTGCLMDGATCE